MHGCPFAPHKYFVILKNHCKIYFAQKVCEEKISSEMKFLFSIATFFETEKKLLSRINFMTIWFHWAQPQKWVQFRQRNDSHWSFRINRDVNAYVASSVLYCRVYLKNHRCFCSPTADCFAFSQWGLLCFSLLMSIFNYCCCYIERKIQMHTRIWNVS